MPIRCTFAAAALTLCATWAAAQSNVQVYGRIGLFGVAVKSAGESTTKELANHGSRLGFKGTEDLGGTLKAVFGLEFGLDADTGTLNNPQYRHSYAGLASSQYGTLIAGRLDSGSAAGSPFYTPVTRIVDTVGYDAGITSIAASMLNARNRSSNALGYASPNWSGFTVRARGVLRGAGTAADPENSARSLDAGVEYAQGPVFLAATVGKDQRAGGLRSNELDDKWQLGGRYSIGDFSGYGIYGRERFKGTAATRSKVGYWLVGASWNQGPHEAIVNVMNRDVQSSRSGERKRWQLAYIHTLSKRTELQMFYDNDGVDSSAADARVRALGFGMRHLF